MTAFGAIDSAVEAIAAAPYHYLTKPFKLDEVLRLRSSARSASAALRARTRALRKRRRASAPASAAWSARAR